MINFNWNFPFKLRRMPIFADNVVATSQPLAAQAGIEMLINGGNAIDAAIASAITLTVVECPKNGIGSDAFAIIWDSKSAKLHGINGSGKSPRAWNYDYFSKQYTKMPSEGWDTVTVPGAVSTWIELSKKFGKLPFEKLFLPAIRYAKNCFYVSPITAEVWKSAVEKYKNYPEFGKSFLPDRSAPKAGEKFIFREQANTLEEIAQTKGESFYRGKLAKKIADYAKLTGGLISENDLATHEAEWVKPISINYSGFEVHELPPNGQGIAVLMALGILNYLDIREYPLDSVDSIHLQIEAMKLAFADLYHYIADPPYMRINYKDLLRPEYLSQRAKLINLKKAQNLKYGLPKGDEGDTVYLTTADQEGMMVSYIQSNYAGFGSGIVVPDTGISLQNRGSGFNLIKDHVNQVDGGKRPLHTIFPGFITKGCNPLMSFGVMGGTMQPQGHLQIIIRMFVYGQNTQSACDALRWRILNDMEVAFEESVNPELLGKLEDRGHKIIIRENSEFGGAQIIHKSGEGYCGVSDFRKDGQAVGF